LLYNLTFAILSKCITVWYMLLPLHPFSLVCTAHCSSSNSFNAKRNNCCRRAAVGACIIVWRQTSLTVYIRE